MPLETASYINQLQPSYPSSTDPVGQADDHIRLIKSVLKATFPNVTGAVSASHDTLNTLDNLSPVGLIALWYGSSASIPVGWAKCDGQTVSRTDGSGNITTPNLVDRFVVGAGTIAAQGATVGSALVTAETDEDGIHSHTTDAGGAHTHTATAAGHALTVSQIPAHSHNLNTTSATVDGSGGFTLTTVSQAGASSANFVGNNGSGQTHSHAVTVDASATHTHTVANSLGHTHEVDVATIPPAIGLHYIMKV